MPRPGRSAGTPPPAGVLASSRIRTGCSGSPDRRPATCWSRWSTQKIKVALGTDGAERLVTDADGVALFGFDPDGQVTGLRRRA
jgi:hypothetical protein